MMILKLKNPTNIYGIDLKKTRRGRGYLALEDLRIKSKFPMSNMPICEVGRSGERKPKREEKEEEEGSGRKVGSRIKTPPRRHRSWRQSWHRYGVLTRRPTLPPQPSSSSFSSLSGFLSPLRPTSRIGILDLRNFDLIYRSSRVRYPRSPSSFFASIRYILVGFFNLRIVIT